MALRILVTGGAGYLGSILVPELLGAGHRVAVVDNFMYRQNSLAHVCADPNLDIVRGDVRDERLMKALAGKADAVIPLAALVGAPACDRDPSAATSINHDAALSLFRLVAPTQMLLMPTTNSAYGRGEKDGYCDEDSPLRPISRYAIEKVAIEKELMKKKNVVSFRLATLFGMSPRMRLDLLVNDFTYRAVTDRFIVLFESHFRRNYLHVRDAARVFLHGLENFDAMKGKVFNVGLSDSNLTKRELCERIRAHVPEFAILESEVAADPDQRDYIVSNDRIEAAGFRPAYSLDRGIAELVKGAAMIRNAVYGNV